MTPTWILIIDDLYGRKPSNRDREDLCIRLGLKVDVPHAAILKPTPYNYPF